MARSCNSSTGDGGGEGEGKVGGATQDRALSLLVSQPGQICKGGPGSTRDCREKLRRECVRDLWPPHVWALHIRLFPICAPTPPACVGFSKLNELNGY